MYYISSSNTGKTTLEHKVMYILPKNFAIILAGHFMNELPLKFADKEKFNDSRDKLPKTYCSSDTPKYILK